MITTKGASGQAPMVLGQAQNNNNPKEIHFCFMYSKGKKHVAKKNNWHNIGKEPK